MYLDCATRRSQQSPLRSAPHVSPRGAPVGARAPLHRPRKAHTPSVPALALRRSMTQRVLRKPCTAWIVTSGASSISQ